MRRNRKENMWNQVQRFSIRKFSFGVTSALLGTFFLANASMVHAETGNGKTTAVAVEESNGNSVTSKNTETKKNTLPAAVKPEEHSNQALSSERITEDKKVNKNELTEVIEKLSTLLNKVDQDNVSRTSMLEFETTLSKAKEVLQNDSAAQLEVDRQVRKVNDAITVVKSMPKVAHETSQPKDETGVTAEQPKTEAEIKQSLELVKKDLQEYLKKLETATDKTNASEAEQMLASISTQLENASATVEELTALLEKVTPVRDSLVYKVSRENSARNGQSMYQGFSLRSAPIDTTENRGQLGIVVADSGFITGYATPSSTIEIKKNGQTLVTSKLDDSGEFKLNAPGIKVGDTVTLVVNGTTVATEVVSEGHTVSFNDSLAYIKQVDGYTAAESDVEITVGGQKYKTKSQSNGYFTVDVDPNLMVENAEVTAKVTKDGKVVGGGTSIVRATNVTDFGVGWNKNPMLDYSERDIYSPDTKQYAFVSKGTADQAYDNIRVYREMRIEENGSKYYYWIVDSGPEANAQAGQSKKISLAIPRTVGDPYDFTYTQIKKGKQDSYKTYPTASAWEYDHSVFRAYVKDGEKRSGASYPENADAWMDYIEPSNGWKKNIYRKNSGDGTEPNADAFPRVLDMLGIKKGGLEYNLVRGVIEDRLNVTAGNRTIMTFKTKVLEGDELDQSIMSDWGNKDKSNPMFSEIKSRLANDPYLAYGGYTTGGKIRYKEGQNAIIGTLPLKPEEATNFNFQPVSKEQTTKVGVVPDAIKSIENADKLPKGTTYRWFKDPDVSKVTEQGKPVYGTVEVVIPQRGKFLVDAAVHVIEDKAQTPVATAKDNGDVTGKPQDPTKVDKIKVSFTGEDNKPKTAEGTKGTNGKWTVNNPDVRIDANTGEITIPENKVKDGTEVTVVTKNGNGADSDPAKATAKDVQKPTLTITPSNQKVVAGEKVEFTVTAKDNTSVNLDFNDFAEKYISRVLQHKASYSYITNNPKEKVIKITITTTAEDVGKTNTITFKASDKDGNNADPVNFNFTVTAVNPDKDDYTPKYKDGNGKPGSKVEIPVTEENGKKIPDGTTFGSDKPGVIDVDKDGKVTVTIPKEAKPGDKITGKITVTYPDGSKEEVPVSVTVTVTTPAKLTPTVEVDRNPNVPQTEQPIKIEITRKPNGDAVVTPKKPDGSTYPPGTRVLIPGDNNTPIEVIIGENGSGEVPNDKLPKGDLPGKGTVTEPNKRPSNPVDVTTPARKTPTSELEQNPKTSDVTETPKDDQTPAQETPATTGEPVQQTQDTNQNILPNTGTADGLGIFSAQLQFFQV